MKRRSVGIFAALLSVCAAASALVQPPPASALREKAFRHPALQVAEQNQSAAQVGALGQTARDAELASLGATAANAFYDTRTGRWSSLILTRPLLPGTGTGNRLSWISGRPPASDAEWRQAAAEAVLSWTRGQSALRLDASELSASPRAAVVSGGDLVYVYVPRVVQGVVVRGNGITAVINHGNLVLLGLGSWGDVDASLAPEISAADARELADAFLAPQRAAGPSKAPRLELVPAEGGDVLTYRLVWVLESTVEGDPGRWETLVDAKSGEILAFQDLVQYAQHSVVGGVFPVSNDGIGPDGTEQAGWPMPWADVVSAAGTSYTDGGGNAGCIPGSISTALSGKFIRIQDQCGAINESNAGDVDLGAGPGHDCTVPAGHSAGDTHSARAAFYELNRMKEQARGLLPDNVWLSQQLTAVVNVNNQCNATWNGTTVNFYRSGGGCGNTGEIAAVFDHEWGHGMDNNGVNPSISSPGESIADIYAALRLNTSCIGRGFFQSGTCTGYGDPCTTCTGIRDADWALHEDATAHDLAWIDEACDPFGQTGPCGRETHCEGQIVAEVAWDLATRELTAAPYNLGPEAAFSIATRLFYYGSQAVTNWYTCVTDNSCGATGGYLQVLAADDDDGNISNGTPHMQAIFNAFDAHQIACPTPTVANSGCAGGPTQSTAVTLQPRDRAIRVSWTAVAAANHYNVYRTEGANGCEFGKVLIAETTDLTFTDEGLQNGRSYHYNVVPMGTSDACFGPMSVCATASPAAGPNLAVAANTLVSDGDGDPFLDNCETATVTISVSNTGTGAMTNVRIVAIEPLTHASTIVVSSLPVAVSASIDECTAAEGSFQIQAQGLEFGETSEIRVTLTSDELAALSQTRSRILRFENVESDFQLVASKTFTFETDLEGWQVVTGTFARTGGGGANGTATHLSSSSSTNFSCDVVRSPSFRPTATSTLSMYERYAIESGSGSNVFDRANVSVVHTAAETNIVINPDSGQAYTAGLGVVGPCVINGEFGWNGTSPGNPAFVTSGWTHAALSPAGVYDGNVVHLEVAYATDISIALAGLDIDEITLTNVELLVPDTQSDSCPVSGNLVPAALHVDAAGNGVLETGEVAVVEPNWSNPGDSAVPFTGTASSFTGPAGPTYSLIDPSGDYGSIPAAGAVFCTDCYSVSIAAASRPAAHWDATVLETVTGPTPAKTWTLHVGGTFPDVLSSSPFYPYVENVVHNGITAGCAGGGYCPTSPVNRQQMAVFMLKAKEGSDYVPPACVTPAFPDVPCDNPFSAWINELVARGVTAGCGSGNYCPGSPTTRGQMAVFLLKTEEGSAYVPPACSVPQFDDVPCANGFAPWINELVARGITGGCGGSNYCPGNPVLRQQMAVFLVTTFGLQLYAP